MNGEAVCQEILTNLDESWPDRKIVMSPEARGKLRGERH